MVLLIVTSGGLQVKAWNFDNMHGVMSVHEWPGYGMWQRQVGHKAGYKHQTHVILVLLKKLKCGPNLELSK